MTSWWETRAGKQRRECGFPGYEMKPFFSRCIGQFAGSCGMYHPARLFFAAMTDPESAQALDKHMRDYQGGSLAAFEALYRALAPRVNGFIRTRVHDDALASDLLQEIFLELHRSRHTYLPGRSVIGWTFGIAQNVLLRHRREAHRRDRHEVLTDSLELEQRLAPHAADFELQPLQDALGGLSPDSRATWWMRNIEGLSFEVIAGRLGIAATAVRLRCSRASRALRAALEKGPDHD
jgi:RNA polymerase sigma-70 factor (ECF subfamily)